MDVKGSDQGVFKLWCAIYISSCIIYDIIVKKIEHIFIKYLSVKMQGDWNNVEEF